MRKVFAQRFFQAGGAIAIAAGPRFAPVFVAAIAPGMRVTHAQELEIFLPIRTLLRERRIAKASLDPMRDALLIEPRLFHVEKVFVARDGTFA